MAEEKQVHSGDAAVPVRQTGVKHPGKFMAVGDVEERYY